ncbi:hypothetical protein L1887_32229 [Cichorium endivia]|nr:hypothetical protein L1887_32229 [Cichorium endivia]
MTNECLFSVEIVEGSSGALTKVEKDDSATMQAKNDDIKLELTSEFEQAHRSRSRSPKNFRKVIGVLTISWVVVTISNFNDGGDVGDCGVDGGAVGNNGGDIV